MCGIAAVLLKKNIYGNALQQLPADKLQIFKDDLRMTRNSLGNLKDNIDSMVEAIEHRGPDSVGTYIGDEIALGMARLAIVGGDSGVQPIWNEERTIAVICNGEIYNYHQLHSDLEVNGHTFSTASDVEVIVHLYEQYQENCIRYLEGTFAFVLWDKVQGKLIAARDRLGVKPLYFAETENRFLFASEIRALLSEPDVSAQLDQTGFTEYHTFRFVPGEKTVVAGIQKLEPAEFVVIQPGLGLIHSSYWSAAEIREPSVTRAPYKQKVRQLKQKLYDAVLSQEASYTNSGILLSGGLDSSALLAMHYRLFGQTPETFTVSFTQPRDKTEICEYNEIDNASSVARFFEANHISECYTPKQVLASLPRIISDLDEPIADPTAIPLWFACKLAHQSGVKVLFSGEGLDELFNGYSVYRQVYWLSALNRVPKAVRKLMLYVHKRLCIPGTGVLQKSLSPVADWYQGVGGAFQEHELKELLTDETIRMLKMDETRAYANRVLKPIQNMENHKSQDLLRQMTLFDLNAWLPENTLTKSDKISMAHSIELRVPFLDRQIVEFALKMGRREKIHGKTGKWIVRSALADIVPKEVLNRKKAGFPVPLSAWMFNEWRDFVLSTLLNPNAETRAIYNPSFIEGLFKTPEKGRRRAARLLWILLCFELWETNVHSLSRKKPLQSSAALSTASYAGI